MRQATGQTRLALGGLVGVDDPLGRRLVQALDGLPDGLVPVVSAGKLYGMIAADKLLPSPPDAPPCWGEITDIDLDALDVFAQLAGRAFAMEEKRGMLISKHLAELDARVSLRKGKQS